MVRSRRFAVTFIDKTDRVCTQVLRRPDCVQDRSDSQQDKHLLHVLPDLFCLIKVFPGWLPYIAGHHHLLWHRLRFWHGLAMYTYRCFLGQVPFDHSRQSVVLQPNALVA